MLSAKTRWSGKEGERRVKPSFNGAISRGRATTLGRLEVNTFSCEVNPGHSAFQSLSRRVLATGKTEQFISICKSKLFFSNYK